MSLEPVSAAGRDDRRSITVRGWLGGTEIGATVLPRLSVRLERDRNRADPSRSSAQRTMSALIGSARRFGALARVAGAPASWALRRLLGTRNRSQRPSKCCFPGFLVALRHGDAVRDGSNERLVAAMLPRVALGRLGRA
jgi:hypothetical protein